MRYQILKASIPLSGALVCAGISGYLLYLLYIKNDDEDVTGTDMDSDTIKTLVTERILIPKEAIGMVIGKQGSNVQVIQRETCTNINFSSKGDNMDKYCIIRGEEENVQKAKIIILKYCKDVGNSVEIKFQIPQAACGKLIGKGGVTINAISQHSGARVCVDRQEESFDQPESNTRTVTIRGEKEKAETARRIVLQKIQEDPELRKGERDNRSWNTSPQSKYREEQFIADRRERAFNIPPVPASNDVRNQPDCRNDMGKVVQLGINTSVITTDKNQQILVTGSRKHNPMARSSSGFESTNTDSPMAHSSPVIGAAKNSSPMAQQSPLVGSLPMNSHMTCPSPVVGSPKKKLQIAQQSPLVGSPSKNSPITYPLPVVVSPKKNSPLVGSLTNNSPITYPSPVVGSATRDPSTTLSSPGAGEKKAQPLEVKQEKQKPLVEVGKQAVFSASPGYKSVFVTATASPALFWVQVISPQTPMLHNLRKDLTDFYAKQNVRTAHNLRPDQRKPGTMVAASYPHDQFIHRARIQPHQKDDDPNLVVVFYVDYGDTELLHPSKIYKLQPKYLQLEFQAIECCLHGVGDSLGMLETATEHFEKLSFSAQFVSIKARLFAYKNVNGKEIAALELFCKNGDKEINIAKDLIRRKLLKEEVEVCAPINQLPDDVILES